MKKVTPVIIIQICNLRGESLNSELISCTYKQIKSIYINMCARGKTLIKTDHMHAQLL